MPYRKTLLYIAGVHQIEGLISVKVTEFDCRTVIHAVHCFIRKRQKLHQTPSISDKHELCFGHIGARTQETAGHPQHGEAKPRNRETTLWTVTLYIHPLKESQMSWRHHNVSGSKKLFWLSQFIIIIIIQR